MSQITPSMAVQIILYGIGALIASMFLARLRNQLAITVLNGVPAIVATVFTLVQTLFERASAGLAALHTWFVSHAVDEGGGDFSFWDIAGPLLYFVFFVVLVLSDAYFAVITFPEVFNTKAPNVNPDLFVPITAILWAVIAIVVVMAALDIWGVTHFLRPLDNVANSHGTIGRVIGYIALVAVGLLLLAALIFGLFRAYLVQGAAPGLVDGLLNILLFFLISVATIMSGISILHGVQAVAILLTSLLRLLTLVVTFVLASPNNVLDLVAWILVGLYDAFTAIGFSVWNWLSRISQGKSWQLDRIPDYVDRPRVWEVFKLPTI